MADFLSESAAGFLSESMAGFLRTEWPNSSEYAQSIDEMVTHTACRVLDQFDIDPGILKRWGEDIGIS